MHYIIALIQNTLAEHANELLRILAWVILGLVSILGIFIGIVYRGILQELKNMRNDLTSEASLSRAAHEKLQVEIHEVDRDVRTIENRVIHIEAILRINPRPGESPAA